MSNWIYPDQHCGYLRIFSTDGIHLKKTSFKWFFRSSEGRKGFPNHRIIWIDQFTSDYLNVSLPTGQNILGMELALRTMRKNEESRFLIRPEYAFGDMGCPPRIPKKATSKKMIIIWVVYVINGRW